MQLFGFQFGQPQSVLTNLPVVWEMKLRASLYIEIQLRSIYARILSEVLARSHEIPDEFRPLLRDSMEGMGQLGLIEQLVCAMANQSELILKYDAGILYVPEYAEKYKILLDWKAGKKSPRTLVMSFQKYYKTTMLRQYLEHKYLLLCTQNKALNLSSALQIKISDLRSSVSLSDSDKAKDQAVQIAQSLLNGSPALLDAKDMLELLTPDMGPLKEVGHDLHSEISLILGLPISWVAGTQKVGLGDSGDADSRSIERGLEPYFWESIYPSFVHLFDHKLKFKSEDYKNMAQALEAVKIFELIGETFLSVDNKRLIVSKLFDIPLEELPDGPAEEPIALPAVPVKEEQPKDA